jgi:hypothetical protein
MAGDSAKAIAYLEGDFARHSPNLVSARFDPALKGLLGERGFQALMRRVGFTS